MRYLSLLMLTLTACGGGEVIEDPALNTQADNVGDATVSAASLSADAGEAEANGVR